MPNNPTDWQTTLTFHDSERADYWQGILSTDTVPILSPMPSRANLPGLEGAMVYWLDLRALSPVMKFRVIQGIVDRFGLTRKEVQRDIDKSGVPILAEDVSVMSSDQGLVMGMVELGEELRREQD